MMKQFLVHLSALAQVHQTVEVSAENLNEALNKVMEHELYNNGTWLYQGIQDGTINPYLSYDIGETN